MENRAVRVLNTIVMGSTKDTVIPKVGQWTLRGLTVLESVRDGTRTTGPSLDLAAVVTD